MSLSTVNCPQCQKIVKLPHPPREGKRVLCPKCGHRFVPEQGDAVLVELLPDDPPAAASPKVSEPALNTKPILLAALGALLLIGLSIGAAALFVPNPGDAPIAKNTEPEKPEPAAASPPPEDPKETERKVPEDRRAEFDRLMAQANAALALQQYEDAAKAYDEALKLFPQDVEAAKGASVARTALAAQTKEKQENDRRAADFARLLDEGKQALAGKQYAQAVRAYENALQLMPGQIEATKALDEAREKLAADTAEKKKLAEYEKFMAAGRAALVAQRYPDALREYTSALALLPNDAAALEGQRMAEKRMADENNDEKRRDAYVKALQLAQDNLKTQKYNQAVQAYEFAAKLFPSEKEPQLGIKKAKEALAAAAAAFNSLMAQGETAARLLRWEEAYRLYGEAGKLFPGNEEAARAMQNAQKMMLDLQAIQAAYLRFMNAGALAMQMGRYADAIRNYGEALRLMPADADAALGLRQAQTYLDRELRNRAAYNQAIEQSAASYQQGRYADAVRTYQDALNLFPDDKTAQTGLRQARFMQYMAAGDADMRAKKYANAIRDFENALREIPGEPSATRALTQARAMAAKK